MKPIEVDSSNGKKYQITIVSSAGGFSVRVCVWEGEPPDWIPVSGDALPDDVLKKIVRMILARQWGAKPSEGMALDKGAISHG